MLHCLPLHGTVRAVQLPCCTACSPLYVACRACLPLTAQAPKSPARSGQRTPCLCRRGESSTLRQQAFIIRTVRSIPDLDSVRLVCADAGKQTCGSSMPGCTSIIQGYTWHLGPIHCDAKHVRARQVSRPARASGCLPPEYPVLKNAHVTQR